MKLDNHNYDVQLDLYANRFSVVINGIFQDSFETKEEITTGIMVQQLMKLPELFNDDEVRLEIIDNYITEVVFFRIIDMGMIRLMDKN